MYESVMPLTSAFLSKNDSMLNSFKTQVKFGVHGYLNIYNLLFLFTLLLGILVNIIVIIAYKTSYGENTNNNRGFSINKKKSSLQSPHTVNLSYNLNNARLGSNQKFVRQANSTFIEEENTTCHIQPRKEYSQSYYARRQSAFVDLNRNRSWNSLTILSNKDQAKKKLRHTLCSYFILSLGCCDLLICALVMPITLMIESGYFHPFFTKLFYSADSMYSRQICSIGYYLVQIPLVFEIEILLTIAINRYSSVFQPIKIYLFDPTKSKLTLISHILFSCLLSLPNLFFYAPDILKAPLILQGITHDTNLNNVFENQTIYSFSSYCQIPDNLMNAYICYQLILFSLFSSSLLIISIVYIKVYRHIYKVSCHQRFETIGRRASSTSSRYMVNKNSNRRLSEYWNGRRQSIMNSFKNFCSEEEVTKVKPVQFKDNEFPLICSPLKNIQEHDHETDDHINISNNSNQGDKNLSQLKEESVNKKSFKFESKTIDRRGSCPVFCPADSKEPKIVLLSGSTYFLNGKNKKEDVNSSDSNKIKIDELDKEDCKKEQENFKSVELTIPKRPNSFAVIKKASNKRISRFRRFSDLNSEIKKPISIGSNGVFDSDLSISLNSCTTTNNSILFRRHTQKIYKHGKTARVLGVATLALALTWAPYWYYVIKYSIYRSSEFNISHLTSLSEFLGVKVLRNSFYLNYVLNAVFYSFVNRRFRQNVLALFQFLLGTLRTSICSCFNESFNSSDVENPSKKGTSWQSVFDQTCEK